MLGRREAGLSTRQKDAMPTSPDWWLQERTVEDLNRRPAELPAAGAGAVVDEQRSAVPEAAAARVHPAAERRDGRLRRRHVVLLAVLVGLAPVAVVMVASVAAAVPRTHAGHGAQRAGQLPPRPAAGRLRPEAAGARRWDATGRKSVMGTAGKYMKYSHCDSIICTMATSVHQPGQ
ncbi:hypothetical protein EYF80_013721 [Liparis tanakae]|uniref:Uncharacterized protein n=1 Tax=Liparis tanakae TaxID=230148 RepID=A0A4Z2ID92_9TELE|nr:hypothetical protein EYF80_013721 [Liparis tanakae]